MAGTAAGTGAGWAPGDPAHRIGTIPNLLSVLRLLGVPLFLRLLLTHPPQDGRDLVLTVGPRVVRRHGYQALPVHQVRWLVRQTPLAPLGRAAGRA